MGLKLRIHICHIQDAVCIRRSHRVVVVVFIFLFVFYFFGVADDIIVGLVENAS